VSLRQGAANARSSQPLQYALSVSRSENNDDGMATAPVSARSDSRHAHLPLYDLPARLGRYMLLERIGVGGMAEVFVAQQDGPAGFQKRVVVKRILPHLAEDPHFVQMFQREARLAASLSHTNIVQVYELGSEGKAHFIAMELVEGLTLHRMARRAWHAQRSVPLEVVCGIVADTASGLQHAHELSLVHRDISPENLMVSFEGVTKILDFGIARSTEPAATLTKTGELKGKLPFLSPEAIRGEPIDGRADLYALGVTMYWLLTGKRPITAKNEVMMLHAALTVIPEPPSKINPSVPLGIDQLVCALLEKDPANRPATGRAVYDALAEDLPPRSSLAAPFVREVAALADAAPGFDPTSDATFVPSIAHTSRVITGWHSAPTTSPTRGPPPSIDAASASPRRAIVLGAAAAALIGVVVTTLVLWSRPADEPIKPTTTTAAHTTPAATASTIPVHTGTDPPAVALPPAVVDAGPADSASAEPVPDGKTKRAQAPPRRVELRAPAGVRWSTVRGKALGTGALQVELPAEQKSVVATDPKRGVRSTLAIVGGAVDYARAPRGKLDLRAFPYAEVFLGGESLGVTPLAPLAAVAGTYSIRFVYKDKEQKRSVTLGADKTERVIVDFR
jgi:eukaryotic-like serine/threonine-protein kinase